jgi:carbamoyl-phosphate synthase large subunit
MTAAIKVLITGAGTVTCQSVIKGFRLQQEMQVHITTADPNQMSAGRYLGDAFYSVPMATDPSFLSALLEIVRREGIQLLVPIVDYEFPKLSEHRDEFERLGCRVVISSPQAISICNEKERTHRFFQEIGVTSPKTWLPAELPAPIDISYPIFVKPRTGRASLGIHKICDAEEFAFWSKRVEDPLYQEFVDGDEYTIDVLCDFDGRVIGVVPRQRIEMKVGISYKGLTVRDPEMIRAGKLIAEKAGIIGPANIQCFKTPRGLVFFEINPRFSGTLPLTIAAGLNSPLLLAKSASGCKIESSVGDFQEGLLMLRFWDEIFIPPSGSAQRAFVAVPEVRLRGEKS